LTAPCRLKAGRQVVQHVPPLLPARGDHRQHPLHEPAPRGAVRAPADPKPDHLVPLGTLRGIIGRRHTRDPREGPQAHLDPREGPQAHVDPQGLGAGHPGSRALTARPVLLGRPDLAPKPGHRRAKSPSIQLVGLEPMPPVQGVGCSFKSFHSHGDRREQPSCGCGSRYLVTESRTAKDAGRPRHPTCRGTQPRVAALIPDRDAGGATRRRTPCRRRTPIRTGQHQSTATDTATSP
jgi:hypothetical protein